MANTHSTLTSLFTDIADAIREKTGDTGDTLTWDGNMTGLVTHLIFEDVELGKCYIVKMSDDVPIADDCSSGVVCVVSNGNEYEGFTDYGDGFLAIANKCYVVPYDNYEKDGIHFPEAGTWFVYENIYGSPETYTTSITITNYTGFASKIIADAFPEAIAAIDTQEDLDPELATQDDLIAQIAVALEGKTGASGGADIETCTVTISDANNYFQYIIATVFENNIISRYCSTDFNGASLNNVIKGTSVIIVSSNDIVQESSGCIIQELMITGGQTCFEAYITDDATIILSSSIDIPPDEP